MNFKELMEQVLNEKSVSTYNIKQRYDYFNNLLFNNELLNYPLGWINSKKKSGEVAFSFIKKQGKISDLRIEKLRLSTFYIYTDEQYDSILVHEMIHIWDLQTNGDSYDLKNQHGKVFLDKMRELNKKVPFTISKTDTIAKPPSENKKFLVCLITRKLKNDTVIQVYTDKSTNRNKLVIINFNERVKGYSYFNDNNSVSWYISDNPALMSYPALRSGFGKYGNMKMYSVDKKVVDDIILHGELIK